MHIYDLKLYEKMEKVKGINTALWLVLGSALSFYMHHFSEELHDYAFRTFIGAVVGLFITGMAIELGFQAVHKNNMKKRENKKEST